MKRWNCKNLAAICLSVCLVVSQSIIPISAYAQESGNGKTVTDPAQSESISGGDTGNSAIQQGKVQGSSVLNKQDKGQSSYASTGQEKVPADPTLSQQGEDQTNPASPSKEKGEQAQPAGGSDQSKVQSQQNPGDSKPGSDVSGNSQKEISSAIQITGWHWVDPDHHLLKGALIIPNTDKSKPVDFDQIVSLLPQKVSVTAAGQDMELPLDSWSCDAFQKDESGNWPTSGEYTFQAHLVYGGGYTLTEGVSPLEVQVGLVGANILPGQGAISTIMLNQLPASNDPSNPQQVDPFLVTGGTQGKDYTWDNGNKRLTINDGAKLTIKNKQSGTPADALIWVGDDSHDATVQLTLAGVNIDETGKGDYKRPLEVKGSSNCTLTLAADSVNTLKAGGQSAGVQAQSWGGKTATLTINGAGTLNAQGGKYGSGIGGGGNGSAGGNITINSGIINATGGEGAAGIGGSYNAAGGNITINGGAITATGGVDAAGIGGGHSANTSSYNGYGKSITIHGGVVTASGGRSSEVHVFGGAGIGNGAGGDNGGGTITIDGGVVTAQGAGGGAGIGGGNQNNVDSVIISGGTVTANYDPSSSTRPEGGDVAPGIGDGLATSAHGTFSTGANGSAFIVTPRIDSQTVKDKDKWKGIIFEGDTGKIYGDSFNLTENVTIPSGKTLTIGSDQTLTVEFGGALNVASGAELTVKPHATLSLNSNGKLENKGIIHMDDGGHLVAENDNDFGNQEQGKVNKAPQTINLVSVSSTKATYGGGKAVTIIPVETKDNAKVTYSASATGTGSGTSTDVASITPNGVITLNKLGTFYVKAEIADTLGYSGKTIFSKAITVNAYVPVSSVSLNKTVLSLKTGGTETLTAVVTPGNATDQATWTSNNTPQ